MTETNPSNVISYAGNPPQIVFSVPLYFDKNSDIAVTHRTAAGAETTWVEGTHYTLVGALDPANAELTVDIDPVDYTPQAGEKLFIRRVQPLTQETAYPEGGEFPAKAHEDALDRLTRTTQQLREELDRAAVLPVTSPVTMPGLPEPVADKILGWNSAATKIENKDPASGSGEVNTASNTGSAGIGMFKQKAGVNLEFYNLNPLTAALTIALDGTDKVDLSIANAMASGAAGLMTGSDKSKLDGIEAAATADQTNTEIKTAYESNVDTNEFSDAEKTKLASVATSANNYSHPNHSGDVTSVVDGAQTIANNAVSNAKAADMAAYTLKLRNNAASGDPGDVKVSGLTEETAPTAGDWLLGEESGGALRKIDVGKLAGFVEVLSEATGTSYTFVIGDAGKMKRIGNASPNTLKIPTNASVAFPVGTVLHGMQSGDGQTTLNADTSGTTTVHSTATTSAADPRIRKKWGMVTCLKIATDEWVVSGEIDTS